MISSQLVPIPRGASLYYALLFTQAKHRLSIATIASFKREIAEIIDKIQEPQVAKAKLSWWSQEIGHSYQQQPHHPLSQQLMPIIEHYALPQIWFQEIITAALTSLDNPTFEKWEDLRLFCRRNAGKTLLMSKLLAPVNTAVSEDFAVQLSSCIQLIQRIRFFGKDCAKGKLYFPTQDFALLNISENQLFKRNCSPTQLQALLSLQAQRAKDCYTNALQSLPCSQRLDQQPLIILAKIYLVLLREIEKENFAVLHHKYSLTPLRKFWVAWTTRLSEKKKQKKLLATH